MPHVLQRRPHPFFQVCPFAHFASLETLCYPEFLFLALAILFFFLTLFLLVSSILGLRLSYLAPLAAHVCMQVI